MWPFFFFVSRLIIYYSYFFPPQTIAGKQCVTLGHRETEISLRHSDAALAVDGEAHRTGSV